MTQEHSSQPTVIPPLVAHHILTLFGQNTTTGPPPPDSFTAALLETISKADDLNLDLLMQGYPEYIGAYRMAAFRTDGIDRLRMYARAA